MYNKEMAESIKKVEANRKANTDFEPRRMTAEEKDTLLATYHPDYKQEEFRTLTVGPNKGGKVPTELAALLQAHSRIDPAKLDLSNPDAARVTGIIQDVTELTLSMLKLKDAQALWDAAINAIRQANGIAPFAMADMAGLSAAAGGAALLAGGRAEQVGADHSHRHDDEQPQHCIG